MSIKVLKAAGLNTSDNPYGTAAEGSFATADNVVIRNKDVVEPRRGHDVLGYNFDTSGDRADEITFFGTTAIANKVNGSTYELTRDTGAALTDYSGTYTPADTTLERMKFVEAQQRFFFTTNLGVYGLDSTTGTPAVAGLPPPHDLEDLLSPSLYGSPAAAGSWFPKNSAVAYRYTFVRKDSVGVPRESPPSGRFVVVNPNDVTVALAKTASTLVTATVAASGTHKFKGGIDVAISPGDGNFPAGNYTLRTLLATLGATPTSTTFQYNDAMVATATLAAQTASSGTKFVRLRPYIPAGINAGDFIRIYRTPTATSESTDPGDEMFLVHEAPITPTDISNAYYSQSGSIGWVDRTREDALSAVPLYTNAATGDGIDQANFAPPSSLDVTLWQGRTWFANTTSKHRMELQVLGVGTPNGVQSNDFIFVGDRTYTPSDGTGGPDSTYFVYDDNQLPSVNVDNTTKSLVYSINRAYMNGESSYRAYYISGANESPGRVLLEERYINGNAFYTAVLRRETYSPWLPVLRVISGSSFLAGVVTITSNAHGFATGDTVILVDSSNVAAPTSAKTITVTGVNAFTYADASNTATGRGHVFKTDNASSNDRAPNRLYYSRLQQPDAVPLVNYLDVGAKNSPILRVVPLRDLLYVFKDDGVFTVSGEYPFRVDPLDSTVRLVAPDSVVTVSNRIFALTTQGVVSITAAGAAIVSRPIESDLLPLISGSSAAFKRACFGVAYETERQYLLWLPANSVTSTCTQAYVYHVLNNTWTRRTDTQRCGRVSPSDFMYLGAPSNQTLFKERKGFSGSDYADETFSASYTSVGTATTDSTTGLVSQTLAMVSATGITIGDVIYEVIEDVLGTVTAINGNTVTLLVGGDPFLSAHTVTVYKGIASVLVYNPQTSGAPGLAKHHREVTLHFGKSDFDLGYVTSKTELSESATSDLITATGTAATPKNTRKTLPREKQRAVEIQPGFSLRQAFSEWRLFGYTLELDPMSERTSR